MQANTKTGLLLALGSCVGSFVTGAVCLAPLAGILLGVSGLSWLTRYAELRTPATVLTFALLGLGFWQVRRVACGPRRRKAKAVLWGATALALVINATEYFVLPHLI